MINIDFFIFQQINNWASKRLWLDVLGVYFAEYLGYALVFFLLVFLIKNFKKYWRMIVEVSASVVFSRLVFVELIHWLFPRHRPFVDYKVNLLLNHATDSALPSGHASFYFAVATVVYLYNKKAGILFLIGASLISVSRVFCGIHWPSDILAGAVVGIFSGWLIHKIFKKVYLQLDKKDN